MGVFGPRNPLFQKMGIQGPLWVRGNPKNWAKLPAHFRASFAVQNDPQIFSPNSSQFVTPCLVAETIKFDLRELLGLGGRNHLALRLEMRSMSTRRAWLVLITVVVPRPRSGCSDLLHSLRKHASDNFEGPQVTPPPPHTHTHTKQNMNRNLDKIYSTVCILGAL